MKLTLAAMLAATAGIAPATHRAQRRSFRVLKKNYHHNMIVSAPHQIDGWNRQVEIQKKERHSNRIIACGKLRSMLIDLGVNPVYSMTKTSAHIRKQLEKVTGIPAV